MNDRKSHLEQVERWARYVRDNPQKWKESHTTFINALFEKNEEVISKILNTKNGKEKIIRLYGIKNKEGYKDLR